jgi:hypothetical protein
MRQEYEEKAMADLNEIRLKKTMEIERKILWD